MYFRDKNYFDGDGTQNYLVFKPVYKYFEMTGNKISRWELKGLSNEKISSTKTFNYDHTPRLVYENARIKLRLARSILKENKVTFNYGPIVNIYIVYTLTPGTTSTGITLENCPFGAVKLTKIVDIDIYKYSGYGIGFDSRGSFSHPSGGYGRNVIIFGADLSGSAHANNKTRSILVLGKYFIQGIGNTTIYAEKMYLNNFTFANKKICLNFHYNANNSYLFVNGKGVINFKAKNSEIVPYPLCLGGLPKDFSPPNTAKIGLDGYVYDFSADYWAIANVKILDIHNYLMKKNNTV